MEKNPNKDCIVIPSVSEQHSEGEPQKLFRSNLDFGASQLYKHEGEIIMDGTGFRHNKKLHLQATNPRCFGRPWSPSQRYECAYCDYDVYDLLGCTDLQLVVNIVHHESTEHGEFGHGKKCRPDKYGYWLPRKLAVLTEKEQKYDNPVGRDAIVNALDHWDGPPIFDEGQVDEMGGVRGAAATGLVEIGGGQGGDTTGPVKPSKEEPSELEVGKLDFGVSELFKDNDEVFNGSNILGLATAGIGVEDVKVAARVKYIDSIEEINVKISERKKICSEKLSIRKQKKDDLKMKQVLEMRALNKKHREDKTKLTQVYEKEKLKLAQVYEEESKNMDVKYEEEWEKLGLKRADDEALLDKNYKDDDDKQYLANLKELRDQLARDLDKLDLGSDNAASSSSDKNLEAARETLECPVCLELMKPPTKIWMCPNSHIVCEPCMTKLEGRFCPTCRKVRVSKRAFIAENFARTVFNE